MEAIGSFPQSLYHRYCLLQARRKKQRAKELLGRMGLPATRGLDTDADAPPGGELGAAVVPGGPPQQTFVLTRAGQDHPAISSGYPHGR